MESVLNVLQSARLCGLVFEVELLVVNHQIFLQIGVLPQHLNNFLKHTFFLCHSCGTEIRPSNFSSKLSSPDLEKLTL